MPMSLKLDSSFIRSSESLLYFMRETVYITVDVVDHHATMAGLRHCDESLRSRSILPHPFSLRSFLVNASSTLPVPSQGVGK